MLIINQGSLPNLEIALSSMACCRNYAQNSSHDHFSNFSAHLFPAVIHYPFHQFTASSPFHMMNRYWGYAFSKRFDWHADYFSILSTMALFVNVSGFKYVDR